MLQHLKLKKSHARVYLKAKKQKKIEMRIGLNVTAMGGQNYSELKCHAVTSHLFFHPFSEWTNNSSNLGENVAVVKCYRDEVSQ